MKVVKRKISELKPAEYNPRKLTKEQENHLIESLERFGLVDPVIININTERKDVIIGGHQRLKIWRKLGNKEIDCVELDLSVEQERELNVRLNANTGKWDKDLLCEHFKDYELEEWGLDIDFDFDEKIKCKTDLVNKSSIHRKGALVYFSIFKKSKDGVDLKEIKKPDSGYFDQFVFVMADYVSRIIRNKNTCLVCPPPRRHKDFNLAQQLTINIGERLGIDFDVDLFKANSLNKYSPDIELAKELKHQNYVLIDDIVTTGQTLEKCVSLLENRNFVCFCLINNN